jgi:serine/threonine protein kinase
MQTHPKEESRLWDYIIKKKLGKGTSGEVFQVVHKPSTQILALKKISIAGTHVLSLIMQG